MKRLVVLASLAFTACILDFDGLSGGTRSVTDGGGGDTGGQTDGSSSSSSGGDTGSSGDCPGNHGPKGIRVSEGSTSFCIDATEVTNAQYAEFLATSPPTSGQFAACSDNSTFTPNGDWPGEGALPVVRVDWCDAYAFCSWAGKRLCGRIGGDHLSMDGRNDAKQSQWYFACSANGTRLFPYGPSYDGNACVVTGSRQLAGSKATCEGGFPGLLDMSGNVEEWVDECSGDFSDCLARGSNYADTGGFACETALGRAQPRMLSEPWRGFRCCSL